MRRSYKLFQLHLYIGFKRNDFIMQGAVPFLVCVVSTFRSKTEVQRDIQNSKVRKQDKFRRDWSQHQNTCKSQSGTRPGVRRSKLPLFACCTLCKIKK